MCFYRVSKFAKSTYRGKRGKAVQFSNGRSTWKRGSKYAKHICLVFSTGISANRPMWFHIDELDDT